MEVRYEIQGGHTLSTSVTTFRDAFHFLGLCDEVLAVKHCGACASTNILRRARTPQGFLYLSYACQDCGSELSLGQNQEGGRVFIKRKGPNGEALPNGGWVKYQPQEQQQPAPQSPPQQQARPTAPVYSQPRQQQQRAPQQQAQQQTPWGGTPHRPVADPTAHQQGTTVDDIPF